MLKILLITNTKRQNISARQNYMVLLWVSGKGEICMYKYVVLQQVYIYRDGHYRDALTYMHIYKLVLPVLAI